MPNHYRTWIIDDEVELRMGTEGIAALPPETIIDAFQRMVREHGTDNVMHQKRDGVWHAITFQEHYDACYRFGKALLHLELPRFTGVSIIGFNSPEWVTSLLGAIMAGCVGAGIYTTNSPHACEYVVKHSGSAVVVCDGLKQLEKFLAVEQNLPDLKALVLYNAQVPENLQSRVPVYTYADFMKLGDDDSNDGMEERIAQLRPGQCCSLIYTSGTTSDPKAVMTSHDNVMQILYSVPGMLEKYNKCKIDNSHRLISFLPLSHVAAQMVDIMFPLVFGLQIYFAQPDALKGSLGLTLKEVRPTLMVGVPRVWEKMAEKMQQVASQATGIKKRLADWAMSRGLQKNLMSQYGESGGVPCGYTLAKALVLNRIKEALGMDQVVAMYSAAAPISREVVEFFGSIDLPLYDFFGASETSGPSAMTAPGIYKIGTSGITVDGSQTKVVPETQELIFFGRTVAMGYLHSEEQTKATIDEEGWLHTGDCGTIDDDGFISITGRIKELIITAGGENIPAPLIEHELKQQLPILSNAMLIGDKRKFLTCLFTLRVKVDHDGCPTDKLDEVALKICQDLGSQATTVAEAKADEKVLNYIAEGVKRANEKATSRAQNIGKYEILDTDFSISGGEMTATLKVKQRVVLDKYSALIEKMYSA